MYFTGSSTESITPDQHAIKSDLQSFVASSEKASCHTLSAASKHKNVTTSSMIMHVYGGSNLILVTFTSFLNTVAQTKNEMGNTRGGIAQTTHAGDLHMLLETVDKLCY